MDKEGIAKAVLDRLWEAEEREWIDNVQMTDDVRTEAGCWQKS